MNTPDDDTSGPTSRNTAERSPAPPGKGAGPERTFAALPVERGRAFARSWWGLAWLKALEDTALDGAQLKLGRPARAGGRGRRGIGAPRPDHRGRAGP